jgi:hypothetical protein
LLVFILRIVDSLFNFSVGNLSILNQKMNTAP